MCGRYSLTSPVEAMAGLFLFDERPNLGVRFNIAPTQDVPVIQAGRGGNRELVMMRWGLVPSWAKEIGSSAPLINARSETVTEKPSFRSAYAKRRCLIPADGFYEWKKGKGKEPKQPFRIAFPDDATFAFAGIWERWQDAQGNFVKSCAIMTMKASDQIADIHHRMPVILKPECHDTWLAAYEISLIEAYEGPLLAYPIGTVVNKVSNDDPTLWNEVKIDRKIDQMDLF